MSYLSLQTVKDAFIRNQNNKVSSPDWGIIAILYTIGEKIDVGVSYKVDKLKLGLKLNELFISEKKEIKTVSTVFATFSINWIKEFFEQFKQSQSILDLAIWYFRATDLPIDISKQSLIEMFLKEVNLSSDEIQQFCDLSIPNTISWDIDDTLYSNNELFNQIAGHYQVARNNDAITLKAEGEFVVKYASDFGAGPFTQPLYASKGYASILMLTDFALSEMYNSSGNIENIKLGEDIITSIKDSFISYFSNYLKMKSGNEAPNIDGYINGYEKLFEIPLRSIDPNFKSIFQFVSVESLNIYIRNQSQKNKSIAPFLVDKWEDTFSSNIYNAWTFVRHYKVFLHLLHNSHNLWEKIFNGKSIEGFIKVPIDYTPLSDTIDTFPTILYGPPGTGKTHSLQVDYINKFDKRLVNFTTFHQSFSYEEFVEGLKPMLDENADDSQDNTDVKYRIEKGVFYIACEKAVELAGYACLKDCLNDSEDNRKTKFNQAIKDRKLVLLCIDEINRGNVASIFGDLISLIEPSKRLGAKHELMLTLPYSKEKFGVPANLVIVGTMNTADRSIQLLDTALRRRFTFKECPPKYEVIKNQTAVAVLKHINARIRSILNKDNQIGHSYFVDATSNVEILDAICHKVIPLLEEYFYNDVDKIRFVLNDASKSDIHFYIEDIEAKNAAKQYSNIDVENEEADFYEFDTSICEITDEQKAGDYLKLIIGE